MTRVLRHIKSIFTFSLMLYFIALSNSFVYANEPIEHNVEKKSKSHEEKFDAGNFIMHHVSDAHEIHFFSLKDKNGHDKPYSLYLPIILKTENGIDVFSSSHFYHNPIHVSGIEGHAYQYKNYVLFDEKIYYSEGEHGITLENEAITNASPLDFSLTKSVIGLFLAALICVLLFSWVGRKYKQRRGKAPKGFQALIEPLIIFIRDEIAIPSMGSKAKAMKFLPFLLSIFFFIWISNLLGLIPFIGGFNVMGTIGVTLVLASSVFIITTINGNKHYWAHIFWPPGVPFFVKLILVPVEILGIFIKPLVLMIRLTANITAGHIIIMAFTALIFILGNYGVGVGSTLFLIFMNMLELLVAFLQAFVFTLLAAIYIGMAVEEAH